MEPMEKSVYSFCTVTDYFARRIYFALYVFWKVLKHTKWHSNADIDLYTGKAEVDRAEDAAKLSPKQDPGNLFEKIWFWVA